MKKWFKFFSLSFFKHQSSKEGAKRGYTNVFLSFVLALIFLWVSFIGADMLPFGTHYKNSPDYMATAHAVFANDDVSKRIEAKVEDGVLKIKKHGGEYTERLLVNTFENEEDRENYSVNGCNIIIDSRPADTLAEFEAYCVSNDGKNIEISYKEYLTLSEVARLNFDFKLRYTGGAFELNDGLVAEYRSYLENLSAEHKAQVEQLDSELAENKLIKSEYNRAMYELYFENYYPDISAYETTSKVPLLRNYYFHNYIGEGIKNYLFIFDDYMAGAFETKNGIEISFYGFYSNLENGFLITEGATETEANALVDNFINDSFKSILILNAYAHAVNVLSFMPFIALMIMVAALLTYSILKVRGVESIKSFGAMFKIVGSFVWFSGFVSAVLTVIIAFFAERNILSVLPIVLFFIVLAVRAIIFAIKESKIYIKQLEEQETE